MVTTLTLMAVAVAITVAIVYPLGHLRGWRRGYSAHRYETMIREKRTPRRDERDAS